MPYSIERAHIRDLAKVKPFWKKMVEHYHDTLAGQWPVRSPDAAWQLRHQEYMTWINEGTGVVFVATDEGQQPVGYAALHFSSVGSTFDLGDAYGELESLAVDPAHRNRGLGARLIEACRKELHKRDIAYWTLDTLAADTRVNRLYARAGFSPFMLKMVQSVEDPPPIDPSFTAAIPVVPLPRAAWAPGAPDGDATAQVIEAVSVGATPHLGDDTATSDASPAEPAGDATATQPAEPAGDAAAVRRPRTRGGDEVVDPRTEEARRTVAKLATSAREASRGLAVMRRSDKDDVLGGMADLLMVHRQEILAANKEDLDRAVNAGVADGLVDRLRLDDSRLAAIAEGLRDVAALPDPVGEVIRGSTLPNGLQLRQVRVPLGVIGMIYEAAPNATVNAVGLALKSGNAVILRGGSAALSTNRAIVAVLRDALTARRLRPDAVQLLDAEGHESARALMRAHGLVDVIIPRGRADLIKTVVREATVPVIETGRGNVHVYVDADADLDMALKILVNAKTQQPRVSNAAETLLVHQAVADEFLPNVLETLHKRGVRLHGDLRVCGVGGAVGVPVDQVTNAQRSSEFYTLELAIGVVVGLDDALDYVRKYSTGHTEAIITENRTTARRWVEEIDAAVVVVNASTRFTDGVEFGIGPEIAISTQKLHARGPMSVAELTSTKWILEGDGQLRG